MTEKKWIQLSLILSLLFFPTLFLSSCNSSSSKKTYALWQFVAPRQMQWSGYGLALSPVIEKNYVIYAAGYHWQNQVYLFVVDQNTGKLVWKSEESVENFKVSGDRVLATTREFIHKKQPGQEREVKIICYKLDSGEIAWTQKSKVSGYEPRILSGGKNFYLWMPGLELYALKKEDGELAWRMQRTGDKSPLAISTMYADGDTIYSATPKLAVSVFDGTSGKVEKLISLEKMPPTLITKMELFGDNLVLFGQSGILTIVDLKELKITYQDQIGTTVEGVEVKDGKVYCGSAFKSDDGSVHSVLNCIDIKKKNLVWNKKFESEIKLAPLVENGSVIIGTAGDDKFLYCLKRDNGKEKWRVEIGPVKDRPIVEGGVVYVAGKDAFYALDAESGEILLKQKPEQFGPEAGPCLGEGKVIFVGQDSNLYAYKLLFDPGTKSTSGEKIKK